MMIDLHVQLFKLASYKILSIKEKRKKQGSIRI